MSRARLVAVLFLLASTVSTLAQPSRVITRTFSLSTDEQTLASANLVTDGPALLDFFRARSQITADPAVVNDLVKQLADKTVATRNKAFGQLVSLGSMAVPALRQAANAVEDADAAERARLCLQIIEGTRPSPSLSSVATYTGRVSPVVPANAVPIAVARLVLLRKPAGATEVLLAYLPFAEDEQVVREVENTLAVVAFEGKKPNAALLAALHSPLPIQRATAAALLGQVGGDVQRDTLRPLLQDVTRSVRLRAAAALVDLNDAGAVPVLIDLAVELPAPQRSEALTCLSRLAGTWLPSVPSGDDDVARKLRRELLRTWWQNLDGPLLLDELRKRTPSEADREKTLALLARLRGSNAGAREQAATALVALGNAAVPLLQQAVHDADAKVSQYATRCLQQLEPTALGPLAPSVFRLLQVRKPPGAVEALLAYAPFTQDRAALGQLQDALAVLAVSGGKPDAALLQALEDRAPERRATAAEILCRVGQTGVVRKRLQDEDMEVRLRAGMALAVARDKDAVPILIALLSELPNTSAARVEEFLTRLAGDKAPATSGSSDVEARKRTHAAWQGWWQQHGPTLDLATFEEMRWLFGHTILLETSRWPSGRVVEVDYYGKPCWQIDGLLAPVDAVLLPGGRVLVAEHAGNRVTERDLKGNVLWQQALDAPLCCQRLPNGHTFLAGRQQLLELDREGKEVFSHKRAQPEIHAARKLANGQYAMLTNGWMAIRLDGAGREVKNARLGNIQYLMNVEIQSDGGFLVPQQPLGKVVELDADGKLVGDFNVRDAYAATRLTNGHMLVVTYQNGARVQELDPNGDVVWTYRDNLSPTRARRR